jgi:hypothetical protein
MEIIYVTLQRTRNISKVSSRNGACVNGVPIDKVAGADHIWTNGNPHGLRGKYELQLFGVVFRLFLGAAKTCADCASKISTHPMYNPGNSHVQSRE